MRRPDRRRSIDEWNCIPPRRPNEQQRTGGRWWWLHCVCACLLTGWLLQLCYSCVDCRAFLYEWKNTQPARAVVTGDWWFRRWNEAWQLRDGGSLPSHPCALSFPPVHEKPWVVLRFATDGVGGVGVVVWMSFKQANTKRKAVFPRISTPRRRPTTADGWGLNVCTLPAECALRRVLLMAAACDTVSCIYARFDNFNIIERCKTVARGKLCRNYWLIFMVKETLYQNEIKIFEQIH